MHSAEWTEKFQKIIDDALGALSPARRATTNLYLDTAPYVKGSDIGPTFQKIRARQRSLLVFADEDPMANFSHPCRYRFYDEKTHRFLYEVTAQFPPHLDFVPDTFRVFHEPVRPIRSILRTPLKIDPAPPAPGPAPVVRERYAILFSGSSDRRHLNDLEYCYRMLTRRYQFKPGNICVLNFDNTRKVKDGGVGGFAVNWPKDNSAPDPFQIPIPPPPPPPSPPLPQPLLAAPADRAGFQAACQALALPKLQPQDLLFIYTGGHGHALLTNNKPSDPWLISHDWQPYTAPQFCDDLATLPEHDSLLIVMQQCYSGLFIDPVIDKKGLATNPIKAKRLSIACASEVRSHANPDATFDVFALDWVTAHLDEDPYKNPPKKDPDTGPPPAGGNGIIEASEAYAYALTFKHADDQPNSADAPAALTVGMGATILPAGDINLLP